MNKDAGAKPPVSPISVLSVSPHEEDHRRLFEILAGPQWPLESGCALKTSNSVPAALFLLQSDRIPIVVCERALGAASWRDLWDALARMPEPPTLIVTSRHADEYLWAEALNLGAHDVLAKPFDPGEVARTVSQAWLHRVYGSSKRRRAAAAGRPSASFDPKRGVAV